MEMEPQKPLFRRSLRLKDYDYTQDGAYFVTICLEKRIPLLSDIEQGEVVLSNTGHMIVTEWEGLVTRYSYIQLDTYIVMPDHVHGIIAIEHANDRSHVSKRQILGEVVRAFKAVCTVKVRKAANIRLQWQQDFYDHIIRNEADLNRIRQYIVNNPARWMEKRS